MPMKTGIKTYSGVDGVAPADAIEQFPLLLGFGPGDTSSSNAPMSH